MERHPEAKWYINNDFTVAVSEGSWATSGGASAYINHMETTRDRVWSNRGRHAEIKIINDKPINNLGVSNTVCDECKEALAGHRSLQHYVDPPSPGRIHERSGNVISRHNKEY